jgi:hypothetical protein
MNAVPFSWMWGDPAEVLDRLRLMKARMAVAETEMKERDLRNKKRRIRKLVKLAKARMLKGQSNER